MVLIHDRTIYLSNYLSNLSIYLSVYLSIYLSIYLSTAGFDPSGNHRCRGGTKAAFRLRKWRTREYAICVVGAPRVFRLRKWRTREYTICVVGAPRFPLATPPRLGGGGVGVLKPLTVLPFLWLRGVEKEA